MGPTGPRLGQKGVGKSRVQVASEVSEDDPNSGEGSRTRLKSPKQEVVAMLESGVVATLKSRALLSLELLTLKSVHKKVSLTSCWPNGR